MLRTTLLPCVFGVLGLCCNVVASQERATGPARPAELLAPVATTEPTCQNERFDFSKMPPARAIPRFGLYANAPTGPGYYSAFDCLTGQFRDKPPQFGYPRFPITSLSFFDADWRYLDKLPPGDLDFFDKFKRVHVGSNWLMSFGGEARIRYNNEYNSRLTETNNDFNLPRVRQYADLWYRDQLRVFAEFLYADSSGQSIAPLATDIDRGDFLNLFIEAKLGMIADAPVYGRVGRQEVGLGSQRLVGTPDWGNTRRTWDGARLYRAAEHWDVDLFWLQPVIPDAVRMDTADHNQNFYGAFVTYKPRKGTFIDAYYLMLQNTTPIVQTGIVRGPFNLHTFGGRYATDYEDRFLFEAEGAMQLGNVVKENVIAGMFSGGIGYHCKDVPMNPTAWAYYNYCSGDNDPNKGTYHTFNQLFPFIHYYQGWVDAIGRQNIHDFNLRGYVYPTNWITVMLQYHHFWLASPTDALYNIAGNAYRRDPTGKSGTDVGQKAEILTNFHLSKRADVFVGYSYLWGGSFLQNTASPTAAVNSSICYVGFNYRW
jgi:hypothetical protein